MTIKEQKQQQLDALYAPYKKCLECPLGLLGRKQVVFGSGNPDARLMIIGEAPGKNEDEQGVPFIGRSGKLLANTLLSLNIEKEDVFITNIVKCRPPKNRTPSKKEISICKDLLLENQIAIIKPDVICTLGTCAIQSLLGKNVKISSEKEKMNFFNEAPIVSTYHPAYILRNIHKMSSFKESIQKAFFISKKLSKTAHF